MVEKPWATVYRQGLIYWTSWLQAVGWAAMKNPAAGPGCGGDLGCSG